MSEEKDIKRRKIKINVGNSPPSDEVINKGKNFDTLMTNYQVAAKQLYKRPLYKNPKLFIGLVLVLVIAMLVWRAVEEEKVVEHSREKSRQGAVISPPLPEATLEFKSIPFSIDSGATLQLGDNARLIIPPAAFGAATGEARLEYRLFQDAVEIFASGIHMVTDTNGDRHLQSSGMIEFYVFQENNKLAFSEGKSIQVHLQYKGRELNSIGDYDYSLFKLDTAKRKWVSQEGKIELSAMNPNQDDSCLFCDTSSVALESALLYQTFEANGFGVWNCDRPFDKTGMKTFSFIFQDEKEADLLLNGEVAVIYPSINSVIYYYIDAKRKYEVSLFPEGSHVIVGVTKKGLWVLPESDLKSIDWNDTTSTKILKMKNFPGLKSAEEVKVALGLMPME